MDYAWCVYSNTGSEEAASVISTWSSCLQWPLFKANQAISLYLVTPDTDYVKKFKTKNKGQLNGAITFFQGVNKKRPQEEEKTEKSMENEEKSCSS